MKHDEIDTLNMRYKATVRFTSSWTDPKAVFDASKAPGWLETAASIIESDADDVALDVLLNLWVAKFGDARVAAATILFDDNFRFWVRATNRLLVAELINNGGRDEWFEVK